MDLENKVGELEFGFQGIQRTDSKEKISCNVEQKLSPRYQVDNQCSLSLDQMNILGLKDYYSSTNYQNQPFQNFEAIQSQNINSFEEQVPISQSNTNNLDLIGQKLNDVIGQYLIELTQQSSSQQARISLDSFSLQTSETLDEEQQQQIQQIELNLIRQKIYKNIVDKLNLSVIQSVKSLQSMQSRSQLPSYQNSILLNSANQFSIMSRSPQKSLAQSMLDYYIISQKKIDEAYNQLLIDISDFDKKDLSKEEIILKLKQSIQLNKDQQNLNKQLREELIKSDQVKCQDRDLIDEELDVNKLVSENQKLKSEMKEMQEKLALLTISNSQKDDNKKFQ